MSLKKASFFLLAAVPCGKVLTHTNTDWYKPARIAQSFYASAFGDALGRVTEFIPTTEKIFARYPRGIKSPEDFVKQDWLGLPGIYSPSGKVPYTDDTAMALLVAEVLIKSRKEEWDLDTTMKAIAQAFVEDSKNSMGWAASFRAPGNACLKGVNILEHSQKDTTKQWWDVHASQAGGCGSVMRAFPFGLVFHDNPEKAQRWAVEHSKLTHGHPIALAACAAMATGIVECINQSPPYSESCLQPILDKMLSAARAYDTVTAKKMHTASAYAKEAKALMGHLSIQEALKTPTFRAFHDKVFGAFAGWAADDAIAATVYVFTLFPTDLSSALYCAIHTPGDSDSIAAMAGALVGALYKENCTKVEPYWVGKGIIEGGERIEALVKAIPLKQHIARPTRRKFTDTKKVSGGTTT